MLKATSVAVLLLLSTCVFKLNAQDTIKYTKEYYVEEMPSPDGCEKVFMVMTKQRIVVTCPKPKEKPTAYEFVLPPAPIFVPPTVILPEEQPIECPVVLTAPEAWQDPYKSCKDAPDGDYRIQFFFGKDVEVPKGIKYVTENFSCGKRYFLEGVFSYCEAKEKLKKIKKYFPKSFIKKT